jgi:hypothetical protein
MKLGINMASRKTELLRAMARRQVRRLNGAWLERLTPAATPPAGCSQWAPTILEKPAR